MAIAQYDIASCKFVTDNSWPIDIYVLDVWDQSLFTLKKPLDSYNEQLQQWEGKKDNEIVTAKIYVRNDMGVYRLVGPSRKRTVGEARKLVARRMVDLRKDMLPYLEASKATQKKLQTYMNHPSFVKEINTRFHGLKTKYQYFSVRFFPTKLI